jgi:hypothetical protein
MLVTLYNQRRAIHIVMSQKSILELFRERESTAEEGIEEGKENAGGEGAGGGHGHAGADAGCGDVGGLPRARPLRRRRLPCHRRPHQDGTSLLPFSLLSLDICG